MAQYAVGATDGQMSRRAGEKVRKGDQDREQDQDQEYQVEGSFPLLLSRLSAS